jgi:hypothetical protein
LSADYRELDALSIHLRDDIVQSLGSRRGAEPLETWINRSAQATG